jgi:hypothetical protein
MEFYPASVPVPVEKRTDRLLLRPLLAAHAELDYDAVMCSRVMLRQWSCSPWPPDDFTTVSSFPFVPQRRGRQPFFRTRV